MSIHIPFHIQLEIIKRLPTKSLIRFMSVCKTWKSMIECSEFVAGYRVRPTQPHHLLIRYEVRDQEQTEVKTVCFVDDDTFPQQKIDSTFPPLVQLLSRYIIIDSCQGLLCFYGLFPEPDDSHSITGMVVLWNPSIRKSIGVALPNSMEPKPVAFVLGFGVCPDNKDSKLVMITYVNESWKMETTNSIPCQVMVFTLSSEEWKTPCSDVPRKSIEFSCFQVVIGQFIYWLAYDWIVVDEEYRNLIMSFDLSTDEFREVELPDSLREACLSISTLRESLVLLEYNIKTTNKQVCDVWMMEHGDPKVFTKLFTINPPNASVAWTVGFRKSGEPIIEMQDDCNDYKKPCGLVVYEPYSEHIKDLGICGTKHSSFVNSYTESLLLLDHDDGHIVRCGAVKI